MARLVKNGSHVEHWLNGVKVVEYELGSPELTKLIAESKFKDMPRFAKEGQGHVALQHHGQEVWFRSVEDPLARAGEGRAAHALSRKPAALPVRLPSRATGVKLAVRDE